MKNLLVVTGGAGFIGSNLIIELLKQTKFRILSIDNYSSGHKKNHIKNKRVVYVNGDTVNIFKILKKKNRLLNQFFILVNSQEFIEVLRISINVSDQTP